jgi:hypothetical protein
MNHIKYILAGLFFCSNAFAIDNVRVPDLRTLSIGGSGVVETALFNPSLLGIQQESKLYANYYNRYSIGELATVSGGLYYVNDIIPAGFEITSFGYDEYRESLFRLSMGKRIAEKMSVGIAIQYIILQSSLYEETSSRISSDIGLSYLPNENMIVGLSLLHIPSVNIGDKNINNEHIASYSIQLGIQYSFSNSILVSSSLENNKEEDITGSFGLEYLPYDNFKFRAGVRTSPLRPSLGVGYQISSITADLGMIYHSILGVSMGIGISYSF